jgi:hypothetical protein
MSEAPNQQNELWVDVPEPEEIDEEEVHALSLAIDPESEPDEPSGLKARSKQPKRQPDMFVDLRGAPFGHRFPRDHNLRVLVFRAEPYSHHRPLYVLACAGWWAAPRPVVREDQQPENARARSDTARYATFSWITKLRATAAALDTEILTLWNTNRRLPRCRVSQGSHPGTRKPLAGAFDRFGVAPHRRALLGLRGSSRRSVLAECPDLPEFGALAYISHRQFGLNAGKGYFQRTH